MLEKELAKKFEVSRTPVLEALVQLQAEGFVAHTKNVGAVVKKHSSDTVREICELIALLEGYATEIAADKMTDKDVLYVESLQKSLVKFKKIAASAISAYVKGNTEFHAFLVKQAGNKTLQHIISDLRKKIYRFVLEGKTVPIHYEKYILSHKQIVKAIAKRDHVKAGILMRLHCLDVCRYLMEVISG